MKNRHIFSVLASLALTPIATAAQNNIDWIALSKTPVQLEAKLKALEFDDQVNQRAAVLKLLAGLTPSDQQRQWVELQQQSDLKLFAGNPDHPEQVMVTVNIGGLASAVEQQWQINQLADVYKDKLLSNQWQWHEYKDDKYGQQALSQLLSSLNASSLSSLQSSLVAQDYVGKVTNRTLLLLLSKQENLVLANQLLVNPKDEFSYQFVQSIPALFNEDDAVTLLAKSSNVAELASMSLLSLTKRYANNDIAQKTLLLALQNPKSAFMAASAMRTINNDTLKSKIHALASKNNAAAKFAVSGWQEAEQ
ncbi:hypothetical protein ACFSJY_15170 [Thalassotalea euphylliae]|uniref:hypothetical protein n=1 Tax=Thalassotalea euphylliae TaxID=1655234 RepID=UPI0036455879